MKKLLLVILISLLGIAEPIWGQTTLSKGDIAFVALNSDGAIDDFSFVLLKDITAGTEIHFTDCGWTDGTGFIVQSGDDGYFTWTSTSAMSAGTVVRIVTDNGNTVPPTASEGTTSGSGMLISSIGDQIFAFQGNFDVTATFIAGIHYNYVSGTTTTSNWDGSCLNNSTSALPDSLTNGVNAVWLYAPGPLERDNFIYNCAVVFGDANLVRSSINDVSNWNIHASSTYSQVPFPCTFTILTCDDPDVPTVTASPSAICSGGSSTLSISGNLNDATAWHIYTGSCGGASIGSTTSSSFAVSPTTTTTYYVRGEGGCVTPGSCGSVTVTVNPKYNLTETASVCNGGSYTFPDGTTQNNITSTVVHTSNLTTVNSCDSIIQTTVNVNPVYNLTETASVCNGGSYTFPDGTTQNNITSTAVHTSNLSTVNSCDSIIQTTVNVNPVYNLTETVSVCSGGSYTFPDGTTQSNITSQVVHTSNLTTVNSCDSIIQTTVNVNPVYNLTETASVCSGDSYTFPDGTTQNNITSTAVHTSNLSTVNSCDSIIQTTVNVNPVYNLTETVSVCSGGSYTFPDGTTQSNITSQVVHTSNLTTVNSCDSIIQTTVNVNPVYNLTETVSVCSGDSYTFPDGTTQSNITSTVMHTSNLTTVNSCDSIIQTTVNVNPVYNLTETASVCSGGSYTFPDGTTQNNITSTVVHTSNLTTVNSCDSIIQTTVNVNPVYNLTETASVCSGASYTFPDGTTQSNITSQVVHTSNLTTVNSCDSIIQTTVNVNPVYNLTETVSVCSGDSYTFPDGTTQSNITSTVVHTSNLTTVNSCDSIIQTTVNVNPVYNLTETVSVCSGGSYTFPDGTTQNNITSTVVHASNLTTVNSCDSIIQTTVNVNPVYNLTEAVEVCTGDSYTFPDGTMQSNITSTVMHTSNLTTINSCDSIIQTTVTPVDGYDLTETVSVCSGDSYTFPDGTTQTNITAIVVHTSNLISVSGCDSIIETTVNVNPIYNLTETVVVCSGDSYTFPDGTTQSNIISTVVHTSNLMTVNSCDSIIETTVNVNPVYNLTETAEVCSGGSYTFPDGTTQSNIISTVVHASNLTTVNSCDSIIETTVNVNPVYNLTETVEVCSGGSFTFPDGTTQSNITSTVVHTSNLTTANSCDSIIETTVNVNPVYNLTEATEVCSGDSYTFPDGTTQANITETVVYTSNLTTVNSCDSIIETTVNVFLVDTAVTQNGTTLTANAGDAVYQWVDCDNNYAPIAGETQQSFVVTENGNYAVIVEQEDCTDTSYCYEITGIGIVNGLKMNNVKLYPNPTEGKIVVEGLQTDVPYLVKIINPNSSIILSKEYKQDKFMLDFTGYPTGVYTILIIGDKKVFTDKIVVN